MILSDTFKYFKRRISFLSCPSCKEVQEMHVGLLRFYPYSNFVRYIRLKAGVTQIHGRVGI